MFYLAKNGFSWNALMPSSESLNTALDGNKIAAEEF